MLKLSDIHKHIASTFMYKYFKEKFTISYVSISKISFKWNIWYVDDYKKVKNYANIVKTIFTNKYLP